MLKHALVNLLACGLVLLTWFLVTGVLVESWLFRGFLFITGGVVFDLDHVIYYLATTRPVTVEALRARMTRDYHGSIPHFYACHCVEFVAGWFLVIILLPAGLEAKMNLVLVGTGWLVHVVADIAVYLWHYRGWSPWLPYWSMIVYVTVMRSRATAR